MTASASPLHGRVALVAGGSGPIGAAAARALTAAGATVAVHYRGRRAAAEEVVAACGRGIAIGVDLADEAAVDALVGEVEARLGAVTVLVNAAHPAGTGAAGVADMDGAFLDRHLDGLRAHHLLCRRVVPGMRAAGFGRVVFVSGALMQRPAEGMGAYAAAKAGATALTRNLALEEGRHGITANVVAPGRVAEPDEPEPEDPRLRELSARLLERMALKRFPTPAEVAETIVALTLPSLSPLTGQTLWTTGGELVA